MFSSLIVKDISLNIAVRYTPALIPTRAHHSLLGFRDERFDDLTGGREKLKDYLSCVDRATCLELFGLYRDRTHTTY